MTLEASPFCETVAAETSVAIAQHPANALFDRTVEAVLPAVQEFASAKNVPLEDHERLPVAQFSVKSASRRTMSAIMENDPDATLCIQISISHSLDVLCLAKWIIRILKAEGHDAEDWAGPMALATHLLAEDCANDRTPSKKVWPDMDDMVGDYFRHAHASDAQAQILTLPADALRLCSIKLPVILEAVRG